MIMAHIGFNLFLALAVFLVYRTFKGNGRKKVPMLLLKHIDNNFLGSEFSSTIEMTSKSSKLCIETTCLLLVVPLEFFNILTSFLWNNFF